MRLDSCLRASARFGRQFLRPAADLLIGWKLDFSAWNEINWSRCFQAIADAYPDEELGNLEKAVELIDTRPVVC